MAEKTIKHLQFWYNKEITRGGQKMYAEQIAYQGDTVDVTDEQDLLRGEESGAFYTDAELAALAGEPVGDSEASSGGDVPVPDLKTASVDDVADWMDEQSPTINDLLELVNDNPDAAQKVLDAENLVRSGDSRKGLVEGLTVILDRAATQGQGGV